MAVQSKLVPALPQNWEELDLVPDNGKKIEQALELLKATLPDRFNYENLSTDMILQKMVPRKNKHAVYIGGLRIFQRFIPPVPAPPAIPQIDITAFFFVRMVGKNPRLPDDAYCMTVGVKGDGSVAAAQLQSDLWAVCKHLKPQSGVATIEIANIDNLPDDLPSQGGGAILRAAFRGALAASGVPPAPGQIKNPPDDIRPGNAWPRRMKSWLLNP